MSQTITVNFLSANGLKKSLHGKVGKTLMEVATANNIDGIAADCGGLMTCATCHVFVGEPFAAAMPPADAEELAMLAFTAVPRQPDSRLSCQITLTPALDGITVTLPASQY
jgi:2Fe-2S ferredoxin